jgi:ADP-ribose pyrophosphatase
VSGDAERLSSRPIFKGRVIDLSVDRVRLPNGVEADLEMIHHLGAAVALPVEDGPGGEPEVLLVRQYRYPAGGWLLEVPGGKLDGAEDPEVCARRELAEEIGVRPTELIPLGWIWTTPGFTDERIWLYLARGLERVERALEDHEVIELARMPLAEAVEMAVRGEIQDAKTVCTLLRAAARLGLDTSGIP